MKIKHNSTARYRQLREKIKANGRSSLTPEERAEFEQLSPVGRYNDLEISDQKAYAMLEELIAVKAGRMQKIEERQKKRGEEIKELQKKMEELERKIRSSRDL